MKSPDVDLALLFQSIPCPKEEMQWRARLVFPASSGENTSLPIYFTDWNDDPIDSGIFFIAGKQLKIKRGLASLRYADFIAGIHEKAVWLTQPNCKSIPGGLTFG